MQNFKDLYIELSTLLNTKIPAIKWIDLWHNQVNFLSSEHPFATPAVFLAFRILNTQDKGLKIQDVTLQVDAYLFYETFADTFKGSFNQSTALDFLDLLNSTFAVLHGSTGVNYSAMRRTGFAPVDTGGAGNLYQQSFTCTLTDYAAQKLYQDTVINDIELQNGVEPPEPYFIN